MTPARYIFRFAWLPALFVGGAVLGAVGSDTFWRYICVGLLGGVAFVAWVVAAMVSDISDPNAGGWRRLAKEATKATVVTTTYSSELEALLLEAMDRHDAEDPATTATFDLRQRLADAQARYTEHV